MSRLIYKTALLSHSMVLHGIHQGVLVTVQFEAYALFGQFLKSFKVDKTHLHEGMIRSYYIRVECVGEILYGIYLTMGI